MLGHCSVKTLRSVIIEQNLQALLLQLLVCQLCDWNITSIKVSFNHANKCNFKIR